MHWMRGPIPESEVAKGYDKPWIPVRRFGVWQSSGDKMKLRPIDDYAENKVNGAFGYADKLDLRTLDQIVWVGAAIARALLTGRAIFHLKDGTILDDAVHGSLMPQMASPSQVSWISQMPINNLHSILIAGDTPP